MLKPALEALDEGALALVDIEKLHEVATLALPLLNQIIILSLQFVASLHLGKELLLKRLACCKE